MSVSLEQLTNLLNYFSQNHSILEQTLELLLGGGAIGIGLIQLCKKIKKHKIKKVEEKDDNSKITYNINGKDAHITVNNYVLKSFQDEDIRRSLKKLTKPLIKKGDSLKFRDRENNIEEKIDKSYTQYFTDLPQKQSIPLSETIQEMWLSFVSISLKDGHKWKFSNGDNEFFASIEDQSFLNKINNYLEKTLRENNNLVEALKNSKIKAKVKIVENLISENEIKVSYSILEILEYKSIDQLRLDLLKKIMNQLNHRNSESGSVIFKNCFTLSCKNKLLKKVSFSVSSPLVKSTKLC